MAYVYPGAKLSVNWSDRGRSVIYCTKIGVRASAVRD